MKKPTDRFLLELARALRQAKHQGPAEAMSAGMLHSMYPEWWEKTWIPRHQAEKNWARREP